VILLARLGVSISRVAAGGGVPVELPGLARQGSDFAPAFLPDGRTFLYYVRGNPEVRGVYVGRVDETVSRSRLLESDGGAVYAPSGHLLFVREGKLYAHAFDPGRLTLSGSPILVADGLTVGAGVGSRNREPAVSVSSANSIAYRSRVAAGHMQFAWFDRSGTEIGKLGDLVPTTLSLPSLSADGQRVAFYRGVNGNVDVWILEKSGAFSRLTEDPADDVAPVWSPDGSRIVFNSNRKGPHDLYERSVTTGGSEKLLLSTPQPKVATDWSRDGKYLLFTTEDPRTAADIWALPMDEKREPFAIVQTNSDEEGGQFSPDGRWIAYQSDRSGRPEIYLHAFPGPGNEWPVSTNGGKQARWSRDGNELFYVAANGRLMAVPIAESAAGQVPEIGPPSALFAPPIGGGIHRGDFRQQYMVSPDGKRFLVATVKEDTGVSPITLILNWRPRP
jgi:Tol biopolymer transport system component